MKKVLCAVLFLLFFLVGCNSAALAGKVSAPEKLAIEEVLVKSPTVKVFSAVGEDGEKYTIVVICGKEAQRLSELSGGGDMFFFPERNLIIILDTSL